MPAYCIICKKETNKPTRASYNLENEPPRYCFKHKDKEMINVTDKKCIASNSITHKKCTTRASYNYANYNSAKYCKNHKLDGMINISSKKCKIKGCLVRPIYNFVGLTPLYCKKHKDDKMVNVYSKRCEQTGCDKHPSFNYPDKIGYLFCSEHKEKGMIDLRVLNNMCEICEKVQANYNYNGLKAKFCCSCKTDDMINVRSPKCVKCNINLPIYNYKDMKHEYCSKCKENDMIDTRTKKCADTLCDKQARYNFPDHKISKFCRKHASDGMINVKEPRCIHQNGCTEVAYYNDIGKKKSIYCGYHKENNMINVREKYKLCVHNDCQGTRENLSVAEYGLLFRDKTHCYKHKLPNEFKDNNPTCEGDDIMLDCKNQPLYCGSLSNLPIRCEEHKLDNDINVIEKSCENCKLLYFLNPLNNLCENCDIHINKKYIKSKENVIKELLNDNNIKYVIYNKIIQCGCSKYRPDFVIDLGHTQLIVEVDENQHKSYPNHCEITRMVQIHQDAGMPIIFIRYNPDNYRNNDNIIVRHSKGRQQLLLDLIKGISNRQEMKEGLSVFYLFYDGFNGNPQEFTLDYFNKTIEALIDLVYNDKTIQPTQKTNNTFTPNTNIQLKKPKITLKNKLH
jgi:predicted GIY-YIG superfamily endonuclease